MIAIKLFNSCAQKCLREPQQFRNFQTASPLFINFTKPLQGEPLKKKKKADPGLIIQKENKKLKKLEKEILRIESKGKILKPVDEIEGDRAVLKTINIRRRKPVVLSEEETERRALLLKAWQRFKFWQWAVEDKKLKMMLISRRVALDELRKESEELYQLAIQVDEKLFPFSRTGPVDTPPIKGYSPPDGDYVDTTKTFLPKS